ncbi:MAG: hypothetical protein LBJ67_15395 [Planctomycetaceae bacterium]|nr:hypothetical protein [Planctomycetaceae bacterium]
MTQKRNAPWRVRFAIFVFTVLLCILIFWMFGFVLNDIKSIPGPDHQSTIASQIDPKLKLEQADQQKKITE